MASDDSSTVPTRNVHVSTQQLGHRAGFGYEHTPSIGGLSPQHADNSEADDESMPRSSSRRSEEGIQQLTRRSTSSKSYTEEEEHGVIQKLDRRLVLFLAGLYLLSFLDRSNIGNARIAGLEKSLSISSAEFDLCLVAFYITYITFEWMILLYRLIPAHIYISGCVLTWGLVASLQSVVTSFRQLLALRAVLGITEAAFGPGVPFYMTFFYRRSELAYRVGLQISAAPLATSFASSLAWLIVQAARYTGLERWRALFLVEGFPSIIAAIVAWYWIPDSPATTPWLTPRERKIATIRLQSESSQLSTAARTSSSSTAPSPGWRSLTNVLHKLDVSELWATLLDPKSYLTALMFLSVNVSFASLPVFLPTIINSMSFSPLTSQLLSAPPYLIAFVFVLLIGYHSDKRQDSRSIYLFGVSLLSCLSYATIAFAGLLHNLLGDGVSVAIRYIAVYPAAMGLFSSVVLIITWTLNNQQSASGKGMGMVILNIVGQCGPLIGVELFPRSAGPLYVGGMAVCACFMGGVACLALILRRYLIKLNAQTNDTDKGNYEMVALTDPGTNKDELNATTQSMDEIGEMHDEDDDSGNRVMRHEGQFKFML